MGCTDTYLITLHEQALAASTTITFDVTLLRGAVKSFWWRVWVLLVVTQAVGVNKQSLVISKR